MHCVMSSPSNIMPAGNRGQNAGDRTQRGALARAVRADQRHELSLLDRQRNALDGLDLAVAADEIAGSQARFLAPCPR